MEENRLKHRLVGATVLVAVGVIFLPSWLNLNLLPGTRLDKTNLSNPTWHLFHSEEEAHQASIPVNQDTTPSTSLPLATESTPALTESSDENFPVMVPVRPLPPGVSHIEIKTGTSLASVFTKSNLSADQLHAFLKLGPSLKNLEPLQIGRYLWIKTSPHKELDEFIYYGPGSKIHTHVVRRAGHLHLADVASAVRVLTDYPLKKENTEQHPPIQAHETRLPETQSLPSQKSASISSPKLAPVPSPVLSAPSVAHTQTQQTLASKQISPLKEVGTPQKSVPSVAHVQAQQPLVSKPTTPSKEASAPPKNVKAPIPVEHPVAHEDTKHQADNHPPQKAANTSPSTQHGTTGAWVVQIANTDHAENAQALRNRLRSKGFPAFVESLYDGSHKRWRVRIGPSTDQNEVGDLRTRLERDAHLSGKVLPYP